MFIAHVIFGIFSGLVTAFVALWFGAGFIPAIVGYGLGGIVGMIISAILLPEFSAIHKAKLYGQSS